MLKTGKNKILVILGPTASGKTKLAVNLADKFNGEIISADSRQVYKGMDVGTGKDLSEYKLKNKKIPYHLIDIINPKTRFNLAKYQKSALASIEDIVNRGKLPILVGGTGLYLQAIVDDYNLSSSKPDKELRLKLEKLSAEKLFLMLEKINYKKAESLNESERKNKRRLIRHIEILKCNIAVPGKLQLLKQHYNFVLFGIKTDKDELNKKIYKRLIERLENENMIGEVKRLRKNGLGWKRLEEFGLEYKFISMYLQKKFSYDEMVEKLNIAIRQFAKKQMTWFSRWERQGRKIYWIKNKKEAGRIPKIFFK